LIALPKLLTQYGIEVTEPLVRKYVVVKNRQRQVNIYGHGRRGEQEVLIVGEAKVRPSRKEIARFVKLARMLAEAEQREAVLLFVAHDFPPVIEEDLRAQGILPIWSYEIERLLLTTP